VAFEPANHFEVTGKGISAVIDTTGPTGTSAVSLWVDGQSVEGASLADTPCGLEVSAMVDAVPDLHTVELRMIVPEVNVDDSPVTFAGVAILVRALTSIGGPRLVDGVLQFYELRPIAGTASAVRA